MGPGPCVLPWICHGGVVPPSDIGSGNPPRPSPYLSEKGWAPAYSPRGSVSTAGGSTCPNYCNDLLGLSLIIHNRGSSDGFCEAPNRVAVVARVAEYGCMLIKQPSGFERQT